MRRARPGYMLLEMLIVMVLLTLMIAMSIVVILGVMRTYEADELAYQRVAAQEQLAEAFRSDVAAAAAAPARWNQFTASSHCLILRRPDGGVVVYHEANAGLHRSEINSGEGSPRLLPLGAERVAVSFERGGPDDRLLKLRWVETRGVEGAPVQHVLEFSAALGGDLR